MVHKKYIKRDGKVFGPYLYTNYRVNGKTKTRYLGKAKDFAIRNLARKNVKLDKKFVLFLLVPVVVLLLIALYSVFFSWLTGRATLDVAQSYSEGDNLIGVLELSLKYGELIPSDARIVIEQNGSVEEFGLSELISVNNNGNFYVEGVELDGNGGGFGVLGEKILYPEVDFVLRISDEEIEGVGRGFSEEIVEGSNGEEQEIEGEEGVVEGDVDESEEEPLDQASEGLTDSAEGAEEDSISEPEASQEEGSSEGASSAGESKVQKEKKEKKGKGEKVEEPKEVGQEQVEAELAPVEESSDSESSESSDSSESSSSESDSGSSDEGSQSPITGQSVKSNKNQISGVVSYENDFEYNFVEGKTAEVKKNSVKVDGKKIGDDAVTLQISGGVAVVSTEYSVVEEGFGVDYLMDEVELLEIDLSSLNVLAVEGELVVKLVYGDVELAVVSKEISVEGEILEVNETNVTLPVLNETLTNLTELNITTNLTIENGTVRHYKAVINRPVKWLKKVDVKEGLIIELPKKAENIRIKTGDEVGEVEAELEDYEGIVEGADRGDIVSGVLTGNVALDIKEKKGMLTRLWDWLGGIGITGNVIEEVDFENEISETADAKFVDLEGVVGDGFNLSDEVALEYYTPGPVANESNITGGKRVVVSGDDEYGYENVLAYSVLDEEVFGRMVRLYHVVNDSREEVVYEVYDLDENGKADYIEWLVPHLSNQTYEIILITKAEHLDSNRSFIENVYEEVREMDGVWKEIPEGDYLRVSFEENLTRERDITLYARASEGAEVEVYRRGEGEVLAVFENVLEEDWYKIYLTNLSEGESYETFDLGVLGGGVEFDYVVDPFVTSVCDSGDVATDCYLNHTYDVIDGEIINATNLIIQDNGSIYNNSGIDFTINLTGNLTILSGGEIFGEGINSSTPGNASNITIIADVLNVTAGGKISVHGGNLTSAVTRYGGNAGILNLTLDALYLDGNISIEGGDHLGGVRSGSGGDAGELYIDIGKETGYGILDINGNIFGMGGTGDSNTCGSGQGTRGDGGLLVINEPTYNLTINGTVDLNIGETGDCGNGTWSNSNISVDELIIYDKGDVSLNGLVDVTRNITVIGKLGSKNYNDSSDGTTIERNQVYAGNMTILASVLNLTSSGEISARGANSTVSEQGYAAQGGVLNISVTTFYFNGNISIEGGEVLGGFSTDAHGGDAGKLYIEVGSNLDINGNIFGMGGVGDDNLCNTERGIRGDGGLLVINEPDYNLTINGTIDLNMGEYGYCGNGTWSNSNITADELIIYDNADVRMNGLVNVSNITIFGDFGGRNYVDGRIGNINPEKVYAGNMTILADVLSLNSSGTISVKGASLNTSTTTYAAKGGILNITVNTMYFDGNISIEGGDHAESLGVGSDGHGGDAGELYIDVESNLDINGNIFGMGGTGDGTTCGSGQGTRGNGSLLVINEPNYNLTINGTVDLNMGEMGECGNGTWSNSNITADELIIYDNADVRMNGLVNVSKNITILGGFGGENFATSRGTAYLGNIRGGNVTIITNMLNLTSSGTISVKGANLSNIDGGHYSGFGGILNITANTMYFDGNISIEGGDHIGGVNSGAGGDAGELYLEMSSNLDINGNIFGMGGTGDSDGCLAINGYRGSGGSLTINKPNYNVTISGSINSSHGEEGNCDGGDGGSINITASFLNITGDLFALGNNSGDIDLFVLDELHINSTLNASANIGGDGSNGTVRLTFANDLHAFNSSISPVTYLVRNNTYGRFKYFDSFNGTLNNTIDYGDEMFVGDDNFTVVSGNFPYLNKSAELWFYNVTLATPVMLRDGVTCDSSICANISYLNNVFKGNVTGFTRYHLNPDDSGPPNVTINTPLAQTYSVASISFNVTAVDDVLMDSCWYTLNSGVTNYTMLNSSNSVNDYTHTNSSVADGGYTAQFYCNDTSNNINNSENVVFTVEIGGDPGPPGGGGSLIVCDPICDDWLPCFNGNKTRYCEKDVSCNFGWQVTGCCEEKCGEWSDCIEGIKTRECMDGDCLSSEDVRECREGNCSLTFSEDLNFISLCEELESYEFEEVLKELGNDYEYILEWDESKDRYRVWDREGTQEFYEFDKEKSYFVYYTGSGEVVELEGELFESHTIDVPIELKGPSYIYEKESEEILGEEYYGLSFDYILDWDREVQEFRIYDVVGTQQINKIDSGSGMFIHGDRGDLKYEPPMGRVFSLTGKVVMEFVSDENWIGIFVLIGFGILFMIWKLNKGKI